MNSAPLRPIRELIHTVRDDVRERREARVARRVLQQELANYTTRSEVDDLLGAISREEGPEAEFIRAVLLGNEVSQSTGHRAA